MNEILWFVFIVVNFAFIILGYKLFGKRALYVWIAIAAILANVQVLKTVELFGKVSTLGNIIYGTSFLATDILNEKYGKRDAVIGVYLGLFTLIATAILMTISLKFIPHESDFIQESLVNIFKIIPRITVASIVAYFLSQLHDTWSYDLLKRNGSKLFIRNNVSTLISQAIDTLVFCFIAFWGVFELHIFIDIMLTTYVLKLLVAVLDTPFLYIAKKIEKHVLVKI